MFERQCCWWWRSKECEDKNYFSLNKCDATTQFWMPTLCTVLSPIPWNCCVRWKQQSRGQWCCKTKGGTLTGWTHDALFLLVWIKQPVGTSPKGPASLRTWSIGGIMRCGSCGRFVGHICCTAHNFGRTSYHALELCIYVEHEGCSMSLEFKLVLV